MTRPPLIRQGEPTGTELALADARYVLEWLRQTKAPENIIGLQERITTALIAQDHT